VIVSGRVYSVHTPRYQHDVGRLGRCVTFKLSRPKVYRQHQVHLAVIGTTHANIVDIVSWQLQHQAFAQLDISSLSPWLFHDCVSSPPPRHCGGVWTQPPSGCSVQHDVCGFSDHSLSFHRSRHDHMEESAPQRLSEEVDRSNQTSVQRKRPACRGVGKPASIPYYCCKRVLLCGLARLVAIRHWRRPLKELMQSFSMFKLRLAWTQNH
jgi:hypothetical protein